MNQYFLKFIDQETAFNALTTAGLMTDEKLNYRDPLISVDLIGDLYEPLVYADDGVLLTPAKLLSGFHVNLLCESIPDELISFQIQPKKPLRVFAE